MSTDHQTFIGIARQEARISLEEDGIEAGAVLVKSGEVVSQSHDRTRQLNDPIAVAEMDCIRRAGRRTDYPDLILYTTTTPNLLVAGTVVQFGIGEVVIDKPAIVCAGVNFLEEKNVSVIFAGA